MPRLALRPLALIAALALMAVVVGAQAPVPTDDDKETAKKVVDLLEQGHMARPVIDDDIAVKWCNNFLKDLDPQKFYFLKADIEEFKKDAKDLDDQIREGNFDFAKRVFERFLKRNDERYQTVLELIEKKPDFGVEEFLNDDPDKIDYPVDKAEADERWRKKIKLDMLQLRADKTDDAEIAHKLKVRYHDRNRVFHQYDSNELLEVYLSSLTRTFDPHTSYLSAKNLEDMLNQQLHLSLEGIGASLRSEDGYAVVSEIVPGMAADKDGRLQPEDKIVAIQKDNGEEIDLVEKKLSDVVRFIRGPRGTKVKLVVVPNETKERKVYEITREKVDLKEQHAKSKILPIKANGKELKLGIINLPAFYGNTLAILRGEPNAVSATADCRKILNSFKEQGVDCVVMDLRDNGGGLLEEAKTLSGLFIDTGPVVQVKEIFGVKPIGDDDEGTAWDGPFVLLINKFSASASEIFAGVIKDYDRGLIIGDTSTFGKGTVQSIVQIGDEGRRNPRANHGALKLTIQQFYRANGESTQINGVSPHVHIPSVRDVMDFGEGKMDNAIRFDKVADLPHDSFNKTSPELVSLLNERSAQRRKDDPKFQKQDERIKQYLERKARHSIALKEAQFKAEYAPEDDDPQHAEEVKAKKEMKKKKFVEREIWNSDFYNDEVVRVIGDYLTLGSKVLASLPVKAAAAHE
ncbi:carboxy terminal-processing peptidase [Aquisphaera insulae]|uniref:carboxy terminal-processing peptidase n=1 Tax=Aquisphaera insulae TaxID=2712864 RepID=UPI0013ECBE77|nr:carboxy terminal-processing peptidase [Aquisphaera insulae]